MCVRGGSTFALHPIDFSIKRPRSCHGLDDSNTILSTCDASFCCVLSLPPSLPPASSGEFVNFIRASKVNLVSAMRRVFFWYFTPYEDIFDNFYAYLEKTVKTGYLCDMEQEFTKVRSMFVCGGGGGGVGLSPQQ